MEVISKYLYVWTNEKTQAETEWNGIIGSRLEDDTDEELDEKYANIEVNFDESETEEDDYVPRSARSSVRRSPERTELEDLKEVDEDFPDEFLIYETRDYEDDPISVSKGKSFIQDYQDDFLQPVSVESIDAKPTDPDLNISEEIDMTDPAVKAAATKIQSVFKGFKTRRNILQEHGYKCG